MRYRVDPIDEYPHEVTASERFNESVYASCYDPAAGVGGFLRIGNQPCEGYAETTVCLFLPAEGQLAFAFGRPEISGNDRWDAGGMRFEVVEPFRAVRVGYEGRVALLDDPRRLRDPREAFTNCPWVPARVELRAEDVSEVIGGVPVADDGAPVVASGMYLGHTEQHIAVRGTVQIGERTVAVDGHGVRDHSWGRRSWQSNRWYRWLTATFGADLGVMASTSVRADGTGQRVGGTVAVGGRVEQIDDLELSTEWDEEDYPVRIVARLTSASGERRLTGRVLGGVPLRNRRRQADGAEVTSRIVESLVEWRVGERATWGIAEYLDLMEEGRPAGRVDSP